MDQVAEQVAEQAPEKKRKTSARKQTVERDLAKESAAANALRQGLALMTDDADAIRDTIEGETDLHEAIASVMEAITEDQIAIEGLTSMIGTMQERKERLSNRIDRRRTLIEQAMLIGGLQMLPLPDATLSIKTTPRQVEVFDESAVPAEYWKAKDPALDKAALRKALTDAAESGETIPGAMLGDPGITLQIRRS